MADVFFKDLTAIDAVADGDLVPIHDVSGAVDRKATMTQVKAGLAALAAANVFTANQRVPRLEIDNANNYIDTDAAGALGFKATNVVMANGAFLSLGNIQAVLFINDVSSGAFGIIFLRGAYNATQELLDVSGRFSVTKDTAPSINVYWDAGGNYVLQNSIGSSRTLTLYELLG